MLSLSTNFVARPTTPMALVCPPSFQILVELAYAFSLPIEDRRAFGAYYTNLQHHVIFDSARAFPLVICFDPRGQFR